VTTQLQFIIIIIIIIIKQHAALHLHRNDKTWKTHLRAYGFFGDNCSKNSPRFLHSCRSHTKCQEDIKILPCGLVKWSWYLENAFLCGFQY